MSKCSDNVKIGECQADESSAIATERSCWAISRLLAGLPVDREVITKLTPAHRQLAQRLARSKSKNRQRRFETFLNALSDREGEELEMGVAAIDPNAADPVSVATMADVANGLQGIKWLWPDWVLYGMLTMVASPPGFGKSMFTLWAIARPIILACNFPDGTRGPKEPGTVIWCDTEATHAITVERIQKWGLPAERILVPGADAFAGIELDDPEAVADLKELVRIHRPKLVVIDSLRTAHATDENSSKVGNVLNELAEVARITNVAIVVVHHTRKSGKGQDLDQESVRGSNALVAIARSLIMIDRPNPDDKRSLRVFVEKCNVALPPRPLGFQIKNCGLEFGKVPEPPRKIRQIDIARKFIKEELASGSRPAKEVIETAKRQGLSKKTLLRAKSALGVRCKREANRWDWSLPGEEDGQKHTDPKR